MLVYQRVVKLVPWFSLRIYHAKYHDWLVVWNMSLIFPYIGNNDPN